MSEDAKLEMSPQKPESESSFELNVHVVPTTLDVEDDSDAHSNH